MSDILQVFDVDDILTFEMDIAETIKVKRHSLYPDYFQIGIQITEYSLRSPCSKPQGINAYFGERLSCTNVHIKPINISYQLPEIISKILSPYLFAREGPIPFTSKRLS